MNLNLLYNHERKELRPFEGLQILDLSSVLAGPLTASFFAELGAKVIKIENKLSGGDPTRQWKLPSEEIYSEFSAYYSSANYGKEIILSDLTDEDERQILESYMADSQIIISNFQKKTAQKLKLEPDEILSKYPQVIFAQLSAYDYDDPRPGYDLVMQGETGWISMTGTDVNNLSKLPVALIDILAAHQMKEAIMVALIKKGVTGNGAVAHISLYKSALTGLANQASNFLVARHVAEPMGTLHPNIAPYGDIFTTFDGIKIILAIGSDAQFKKLWFSLINNSILYRNFELNTERLKNRHDLTKILQQKISKLRFLELENILNQNNLPFCNILNMDQVFQTPMAAEMVNYEKLNNYDSKSVSSIAFEFKSVGAKF